MIASKTRQIERWSKLIQPKLKEMTCIICDNTDLYDNYNKLYANDIFCAGTIIRHQCPNCSLIFGDLRFLNLSEEEISKDHDDTYSYFSEGDTLHCQFYSFNSIKICSNKNLKYLDYACGNGKFFNFMKTNGYDIYGYDKYVKGNNVLNTIDNLKYDVIISNNFIEHLIDPIEQIKNMLNHLNDDGYLIFISDCIDEYAVEFTHFHTYYYVGKSFEILCNKLHLILDESKIIGPCKIKVLKKNVTNNMEKIMEVKNCFHLGDQIINFIFFKKIKDYIESNNIIIHYYCHQQYHKNIVDFKCSENIKLFDYEEKGYQLWQGTVSNYQFIEDRLCIMFNECLKHYKIPITVNAFEYEDMNLFERLPHLDKYKHVNVLVINSHPHSGQYHYDKNSWDKFIVKLSQKYVVATTEKVNDTILSLHDVSVKNIASIALHVKIIIAVNTGPSIPLYNTHILNNIDAFYLFDDCGSIFKTRKIKVMQNINDLSFLL